jgi:phosphonate transport system substrate-binding protein
MRNDSHLLKKVQFYFLILGVFLCWQNFAYATQVYRFGVANKDTVMSTAAQWNPILLWLEKQTGIKLELHMGVSLEDTQLRLMHGEYDFFVGYPFLQPGVREKQGFRVILQAKGGSNEGAIVVQSRSEYHVLSDLKSQVIYMPHEGAFIAHTVPMAELIKQNIPVKIHTVGNQEALVTEFRLGRVKAAAVNVRSFEKVMLNQAGSYRILWRSASLPPLPIGVQNSVPKGVAERVQTALLTMAEDPEGKAILAAINQRMGLTMAGWVVSNDETYQVAIDSYIHLLKQQKQGK